MGNFNTQGVLQNTPAPSAGKAGDANTQVKASDTEIETLDALQMLLDVVGLIPGAGAPADALNAVISAVRGDWIGAGLSLLGVVPAVGEGATAAKIAKNADKYAAAMQTLSSKLPKPLRDKLAPYIDAAKQKIGELGGKAPKKEPDAPPKPKEEGKNGEKIKAKKKMKCGEHGSYGDLKKKTGEGKFDRDHIPSKAALKARAEELLGEALTPKAQRAIDAAASAIAIPRQAHIDVSPTHGQSASAARRDAGNLEGAARRDIEAMLGKIDEYDEDGGCRKAYQQAASKVMRMSNADYDKWLLEVIGGLK